MRPRLRYPLLFLGLSLALAGPAVAQTPLTAGDSSRPALFMSRNRVPAYPELLRRANVEAAVVIEVVVDSAGRLVPESLQVVSSSHDFATDSVEAAVREWQWAPALRLGLPVAERKRYAFEFKLWLRHPRECPTSFIERQVICAEAGMGPVYFREDWPVVTASPPSRRGWLRRRWPF